MNVRFRSFMLSIPIRDPEGSQQLLFFTQKLFAYMQESYQRFIDPISVVTSIKTYDDTLIDIHSQMDVDEFYNLLFDRWEGQLQDDAEKKLLRSFYGGQLVQQVKSKECQHISERLEPFSAIQCDIKGKSTLEESLEAYVHGEVMEGGKLKSPPAGSVWRDFVLRRLHQKTSTSAQLATVTSTPSKGRWECYGTS